MIGAIAGDMVGAPYEWDRIKTEDFPLFSARSILTDDTAMTVATAHALMTDGDYCSSYWSIGREYPFLGYGTRFAAWIKTASHEPYNSFGNGSAMRVSPVGYAFDREDLILAEAERSAAVSHNHPEGIKGAQAVALAIWMARNKATKEDIGKAITARFGYDLSRPLEEVRLTHEFDETCQGSVPEAFIALLASNSFEDAVRKAVSLGGDADTQACIAGAVAEPLFGIPSEIKAQVLGRLDPFMLDITQRFCEKYGIAL